MHSNLARWKMPFSGLNRVIGQEKASSGADVEMCTVSISVNHSRGGVRLLQGTDGLRWPAGPGQGEETLPSISGSGVCPHTDRERGDSTSMRVERARVDDWEVHSVPSSSVRDSVNQRKHKDQTVLQVVLEAQLCANFTGNVLFCLWLGRRRGGGFQLPLHTVHMKRMEKSSASGFVNRIVSQRGCGCDTRRETALPFCLERRKRTFKVFSGLGQLSVRVLLKHLTPLCIQCHINLAP